MRFCGNIRWEVTKLKKVSKIYDGTHETPDYKETGIKFVSVENINNLYASNKYISVDDYKKNYKVVPQLGDLFMTRIGDIGTPCVVTINEPLAFYVSLALIKPQNIDNYFLNYYIQTPYFKRELWQRTLHMAIPQKINKDEIGECRISIPSNQYQSIISNFFIKLDKRIETQNKIISALESQKKAICNQIRTIESNTIEASIIFEFMDKTNHQSSDGNDSGNYIFFTNEETTNKFLDTFDFDGEYIIANTGGKANFKYFNGKFASMSDCLVIKTKFAKFYYYYLQSIKDYVDYVGFEGSGLKHLNKKWLLKLQIPSFNEKHKHIVETLDLLDCKLAKEKLILQKYKEQKKFLLSNMFI